MANDTADQLKALRHSAEHVLTQAMVNLYGQDKVIMAMGPATEDGFYFDFDSPKGFRISEADLPKIEQAMQQIIDADLPITKKLLSIKEARKLFKDNPYKQEWLDEIEKKGEKATVYWTGDQFVDLCSGPHLESTGRISAFKLLSVAGAYWHGDEKNKMLTRIYGTAFPSKKELGIYLARLEKAQKRDHRKLGKELDLFVFAELVGKGLPLLTPKGTIIRKELENYILKEEAKRGYQHVITPPLAKVDLYRTSGHYPYYKDTMYPVMQVDNEELLLRPMTCPHHFMLYQSRPRSYRELPVRFAELSPQFRYEKSGELSGLTRVRMFCLADAHIICAPDQAKSEIKQVLALIDDVNADLGLVKGKDYRYRLSLGDRADEQKYFKDDQAWDNAEQVLREVLDELKAPYFEAAGEAAFYGPKIDVQITKLNGQEETAFTVQYDFVMPGRFKMQYIDSAGKEKQPIVIHRSSIGAFERTMAFLIEHYGGAFPVWLSPVQVAILPITDEVAGYGKQLATQLEESGVRVELDSGDETLSKKIRNWELEKVPYMLIVGQKEADQQQVTVRRRGRKNQPTITLDAFAKQLKQEIEEKVIF